MSPARVRNLLLRAELEELRAANAAGDPWDVLLEVSLLCATGPRKKAGRFLAGLRFFF